MSDTPAAPSWADATLAPWWLALQAAQAFSLAPRTLTQPINTGWTFGNLIQVTEQNSTAPATEQEIVRHHSYGRQIGRVMDAVDLLIEHASPALKHDARAVELLKIRREVEAIKTAQARRRLERLRDELLALKQADAKAWRSLRTDIDAG
ncbi:MAG TPA: hypothetical protein VI032_15040 [Burkholderiaceae bacterium]